jgi:molybdopterin synthase catalytic subunit
VLVIHRIGTLLPADQIVLVVVASSHRGAAFAGCEFLIDSVKTEAPFWKSEATPHGVRWVDASASDDAARRRWLEAGAGAAVGAAIGDGDGDGEEASRPVAAPPPGSVQR